jgi:hypothetical protein
VKPPAEPVVDLDVVAPPPRSVRTEQSERKPPSDHQQAEIVVRCLDRLPDLPPAAARVLLRVLRAVAESDARRASRVA